MNYSIGEVSRMFGLPQSTLRYYDKEGLLPQIQRQGAGIRRFDEQAIEALRVIECLKKSGLGRGKVRIAHCKNPEAAQKLRDMILAEAPDVDIAVSECGGLCGFYAERGGLLVGFEKF